MLKPCFNSFGKAAALASCLALGSAAALTQAAAAAEPELSATIRLSSDQYKQTVYDIFGPAIKLTGRFEPGVREEGLLAVGAKKVGITDSGIERYDDLARGIAQQVLDPANRATYVPCQPKSATAADDACARKFISGVGRAFIAGR